MSLVFIAFGAATLGLFGLNAVLKRPSHPAAARPSKSVAKTAARR